MRRFERLMLLIVLLSACAARAAQPTTAPIATAVNFKALAQGQDAAIAIVVDVPPGLHAQSSTSSQPSFIPFKVTMEPSAAVVF
jgi:curli biogenesis system outer membrane secretion channel CsgG